MGYQTRTIFYRLGVMATVFWLLYPLASFAIPQETQLSVWANEAIVATYTYNYKNFLPRQREIAKYFTSTAWKAYSDALQKAKLPESVNKNSYTVSSVATSPPVLTQSGPNQWHVVMPILVLYENPQYKQTQHINVNLFFKTADSGQGVRGLVITALNAELTSPACSCEA